MIYKLQIEKTARKWLEKQDGQTQDYIRSWIRRHLVGNESPRSQGKPLKGSKKGLWRYRAGDFRIIAKIYDSELLILVVEVGNRKDIYES